LNYQRTQRNSLSKSQFIEGANRIMQLQAQKTNRMPTRTPKAPQGYLNWDSRRSVSTTDKVGLGVGFLGLTPGVVGTASNAVSGIGVGKTYYDKMKSSMNYTRRSTGQLRRFAGRNTRSSLWRRR
jgi:hypothetical protein